MKKLTNTNTQFNTMCNDRKQYQKDLMSAFRIDYKLIAANMGIRDADSFSEWSRESHSPHQTLDGLYALSVMGSSDAFEWLKNEAYGHSRIVNIEENPKALRKIARKRLSTVAIFPHSPDKVKHLNKSYLEMLGDYHLGLFGKVKNMNLSQAARYYCLASEKNDDSTLKLKRQCVELLMGQLSDKKIEALERQIVSNDFVAYAIATYYFERMKAKKKKHGKRFKTYRKKLLFCLQILLYVDCRFVDSLFKEIKNSKLIK